MINTLRACSSYITGLFIIFRVADCQCDPCTTHLWHESLHVCVFCQQEKSSSSVKLPNIEKTSARGGNSENERFKARNWKVLSKKEIQKLPPQQRSKYLAVRDLFYTKETQQNIINHFNLSCYIQKNTIYKELLNQFHCCFSPAKMFFLCREKLLFYKTKNICKRRYLWN